MNENLITNVVLGAVMVFVIWFMFESIRDTNTVDVKLPIVVTVTHGSFQPALIQVPSGKPIKLHFVRADLSSCSDMVAFPQFHYAYQLPLNQKVEVNLPPLKRGEWDFQCPRGLTRGKIIAT